MSPIKDQGDKLDRTSKVHTAAKRPKEKKTADLQDKPLKDQGDKLEK